MENNKNDLKKGDVVTFCNTYFKVNSFTRDKETGKVKLIAGNDNKNRIYVDIYTPFSIEKKAIEETIEYNGEFKDGEITGKGILIDYGKMYYDISIPKLKLAHYNLSKEDYDEYVAKVLKKYGHLLDIRPEKYKYSGIFEDGWLKKGKMESLDGKIKYEGTFDSWCGIKLHGKNCFLYDNDKKKCRYFGEMEQGEFSGQGVYESLDGEIIYKGEFENGMCNGKGCLHNSFGVYEGLFKNNLFIKGKYKSLDGKIEKDIDFTKFIGDINATGHSFDTRQKAKKIHNNKTEQLIFCDFNNRTIIVDYIKNKLLDNNGNGIKNIAQRENIQYKNLSSSFHSKNCSKGNKNASKHIKIAYISHGDYDRVIQDTIKEKNLNYIKKNTESFYIQSMSCHGGFYDEKGNNLFDIVKKQIKKSKENCIGFLSLVDSCFTSSIGKNIDQNLNVSLKKVFFPLNDNIVNLYNKIDNRFYNKNDFVDYYCVLNDIESNTQKIYQIPAELCYWREYLIDNKLFDKAFEALKNGKEFIIYPDVILNDGASTIKKNYKIVLKGKIKEVEVVKTGKKGKTKNGIIYDRYDIKEVKNKNSDLSLNNEKHKYNVINK